MAEIHIITEQESHTGWIFTARIGRGTRDSLHTVALSWADAEHWTHGTIPPAQLATAIVRVALAENPATDLPECFDAGRLSREIENFAEKLSLALSAS